MGSFEFGSDDATAADDPATDPEPAADGGAAFGEPADTAVAPAEPEPLPADLDPDSRDDPSPTSGRAADADAPAPATRASVDAVDAALLYAGEEPRAELPVADGRLVATSHRVIAYAPDDDERATLRGVHRANVRAVRLSSTGTDWLARPIAYCVVGGLAMVAGGSLVSFDAMSTTMPDSAGATGVGGLLSTIGGSCRCSRSSTTSSASAARSRCWRARRSWACTPTHAAARSSSRRRARPTPCASPRPTPTATQSSGFARPRGWRRRTTGR
ncbi:hypothetical protein ACFQRB_06975 [Halobaculum litoreum]|uniref:Uncharacterized protein n=1 Tax=Halobaculum litoreum TaxID=3031998 RepID=A0ABD5XRT4_9EURY